MCSLHHTCLIKIQPTEKWIKELVPCFLFYFFVFVGVQKGNQLSHHKIRGYLLFLQIKMKYHLYQKHQEKENYVPSSKR